MFFNDSIADMLTRIRNAATARKAAVIMPHSKMNEAIARILLANHFLSKVEVAEAGGFKSLELTLPTDAERLTALVRVSKPGRRVYVGSKDIPTVLGGRGLVILSTSGGIMSGREARKAGLGGELICKVW
jgi:small subunit ribosomal protein S8